MSNFIIKKSGYQHGQCKRVSTFFNVTQVEKESKHSGAACESHICFVRVMVSGILLTALISENLYTISHLVSYSVSVSVSQSVYQSVTQSVSEWVNEHVNQSVWRSLTSAVSLSVKFPYAILVRCTSVSQWQRLDQIIAKSKYIRNTVSTGMIDMLIDSLTDRLSDWLIHWLTNWLCD